MGNYSANFNRGYNNRPTGGSITPPSIRKQQTTASNANGRGSNNRGVNKRTEKEKHTYDASNRNDNWLFVQTFYMRCIDKFLDSHDYSVLSDEENVKKEMARLYDLSVSIAEENIGKFFAFNNKVKVEQEVQRALLGHTFDLEAEVAKAKRK